jgi:hypothetical protein
MKARTSINRTTVSSIQGKIQIVVATREASSISADTIGRDVRGEGDIRARSSERVLCTLKIGIHLFISLIMLGSFAMRIWRVCE